MAGEDKIEDKNQKKEITIKQITIPFQSKTGKDCPSSTSKHQKKLLRNNLKKRLPI